MKKRNKIYIFIAITLVLIVTASCYLIAYNSIKIRFNDKTNFEYGEVIKSEDLVIDYDAETIDYPELNTHLIGNQKLKYKCKKGIINKTIINEIEIVDTKSPIIELKEDVVKLECGDEYELKNNISKVYDEVDGELEYQIKGEFDKDVIGTYPITVIASDLNGNKSEKVFTIEVIEKRLQVIDGVTYIDGILIVNKDISLPEDYGAVDPVAEAALEELRSDAEDAGYYLPIISGFRDYDYQVAVYWGWVESHGQEQADTFSARPGHSEHQTGLTWDIGILEDWFGETDAGIWLEEHCADYGFIIRYPLGKEEITGYKYEPWHVRYVGKEHAKKIMDSGLCLEEYLGIAD